MGTFLNSLDTQLFARNYLQLDKTMIAEHTLRHIRSLFDALEINFISLPWLFT